MISTSTTTTRSTSTSSIEQISSKVTVTTFTSTNRIQWVEYQWKVKIKHPKNREWLDSAFLSRIRWQVAFSNLTTLHWLKQPRTKKSWLVYVAGSRHCRRKPGDKGIIAGHRKSSPMQMWSKAAATDIASKASFYWWMVICFHDCVAFLFQWQQFHECS